MHLESYIVWSRSQALSAWVHRLRCRHGSENDDVAAFGADQLYVVFVVADGGTDLERFDVRSAAEARSILLQARCTLDSSRPHNVICRYLVHLHV